MYKDPIGHRIKTLNNLMKKSVALKAAHHDRATLMHAWIIGFVQERRDVGKDTFPKDIEKEFCINRSTTSEMLKLMCKKGMITREEVDYDARLKKIILTDESKEQVQRFEDKMKGMHELLIMGLSEEEIDTFITVSDKLIDNLKNNL